MAITAPGDLVLTPLHGDARPLREWLTTFHLATIALDPYTNESAWILPPAQRVLEAFKGAAVRVNILVTCGPEEAEQFLGPLAQEYLVFCDPDRVVVKGFGLQTLPAFVFVRMDASVTAAEGWNGTEWRSVAKELADVTQWTPPLLPETGDPSPFAGTPAVA